MGGTELFRLFIRLDAYSLTLTERLFILELLFIVQVKVKDIKHFKFPRYVKMKQIYSWGDLDYNSNINFW